VSHVAVVHDRRRQRARRRSLSQRLNEVRRTLHAVQRTAPGLLALATFGLLAVVRIAGAWSEVAMPAAIALTPAAVLLLPRSEREPAGLHLDVGARQVAEGVAVVLGSYVVVVAGCLWVFGSASPHDWLGAIRPLFESMAPFDPGSAGHRVVALALAVVCMGVLVPAAEEVFFRGVLHRAASRRWGPLAAVLLTASGWALVHLGDYGLRPFDAAEIAGMLPSVALMGLALGWCRVRTGSALACVVAQGAANLALTVWVFGVMAR